MTFYIEPAVPFVEFDENFEYRAGANLLSNLMRYCGYRTLHRDCFLYKWLQERLRTVKFAGEHTFREWCTYPSYYDFSEKMLPHKMTVDLVQMHRWRKWLQSQIETLRANCRGHGWSAYYNPRWRRSDCRADCRERA